MRKELSQIPHEKRRSAVSSRVRGSFGKKLASPGEAMRKISKKFDVVFTDGETNFASRCARTRQIAAELTAL